MSLIQYVSSNKLRRASLLLVCALLLPLIMSCGAVVPVPTVTMTATVSNTPAPTTTQTPRPTITPTPTKPAVMCGGPPAMFILLVGSDARRDSYAVGLADAVRLVRLDFIEGNIQVLAFPRDLYVEIPGIEEHNGITHGKLNQAYLYGNPGYDYYDGPGQGPGLLAATLEHNFGAQVDQYVAVNLQTFVRIIDTLGGIDIDLPETIDGRVKRSRDPSRYFPEGEQHLDGYRTMLLARVRPGGDLQRLRVQNLVLQAVAEKVLSPSVILKLPNLIGSLREFSQTDLGPVEIGRLLCFKNRVDPQEIEFLSFPEDLFTSDRVPDPVLGNTSILAADFEILRDYVTKFNEGTWHHLDE